MNAATYRHNPATFDPSNPVDVNLVVDGEDAHGISHPDDFPQLVFAAAVAICEEAEEVAVRVVEYPESFHRVERLTVLHVGPEAKEYARLALTGLEGLARALRLLPVEILQPAEEVA